MSQPSPDSRLSDLNHVSVGHWSDHEAKTGCTVVVFDKSCVASVHVAGGAPGSQETDLLDPSCLVAGVDAILLTGGSAFGLAAASGVRKYLEEKGRGFNAAGKIVPIVPAAVIFDLWTGEGDARPGPEEGYKACLAAEDSSGEKCGSVGAGTGATVGKYLGPDSASPGGAASLSMEIDNGSRMGALMVVNCYGAVTDPETGKTVAGPSDENGKPLDYLDSQPPPPSFGATAIGVVVTDAKLDKASAKRVAIMAHDGLARAVRPSHTPYDGDMIFVVSTGGKVADTARLGAWAARLVERCVVKAVE